MNVSGQLHAVAVLLSEKAFSVPNEEEAGWAPEQVWTFWRRDKSPAVSRM